MGLRAPCSQPVHSLGISHRLAGLRTDDREQQPNEGERDGHRPHRQRALGRLPVQGRRHGRARLVRDRHLRHQLAGPRRAGERQDQPGGADRRRALDLLLDGLSHGLDKAGTPPTTVDTTADVTFQPGEGITGDQADRQGGVPGISAEDFEAAAQDAKANCPVSQALTGTTITLEATLVE